jgi:polyhydroxyalkanoate synthesis regulator phasin
MSYEENKKLLDSILNEAQGRGDAEFYGHLERKLEQLSQTWATKDEDGDLTREEVTRLIERKYFVLRRIEELKRSAS